MMHSCQSRARDFDEQMVDFQVPITVEHRHEIPQRFRTGLPAHRKSNSMLTAVGTGIGDVGYWLVVIVL